MTNSYDQRLHLVPAAIATAAALLLAWRSLHWPLIHDSAVMAYIAWLITEGAVPYRDIFDMNLPGAYLVYIALWKLFGSVSSGWRAFDLVWLMLTCIAIARLCRGLTGRSAAWAAAALFAVYHLANGALEAGERDFLICVFLLIGADQVARWHERDRGALALIWPGLALGAAMSIKPLPILFAGACLGAVACSAYLRGRDLLRPVAVFVAAAAAIPAVTIIWLAWVGGLPSFVDAYLNYVMPIYSRDGRSSQVSAARYALYHLVPVLEWGLRRASMFVRGGVMIAVLLAAAGLLWGTLRDRLTLRLGLALCGLVYGVLHYLIQGKVWPYHLYPLVAFFCVAVGIALEAGLRSTENPAPAVRRAIAIGMFVFLAVGFAIRGLYGTPGLTASDDLSGEQESALVAAITTDLQKVVPDGGTVQVMDDHLAAIQALLKLRLRQPTRFVYDFHFYFDENAPRIRDLRAELVSALGSNKPNAVVMLPNYRRFDTFPEIGRLLQRDYDLTVETQEYRIYSRRSDLHPVN